MTDPSARHSRARGRSLHRVLLTTVALLAVHLQVSAQGHVISPPRAAPHTPGITQTDGIDSATGTVVTLRPTFSPVVVGVRQPAARSRTPEQTPVSQGSPVRLVVSNPLLGVGNLAQNQLVLVTVRDSRGRVTAMAVLKPGATATFVTSPHVAMGDLVLSVRALR